MHSSLLPILIQVALSQSAVAQTAPAFPPGALETEARLLARAGPQARVWVKEEAARELDAGTVSQDAASRAGTTYRNRGGSNTVDIEAMTFLVMMEAAKSAQEDLRSIMDRVRAINAAKASMRQSVTGSPVDSAGRRASPPAIASGPASRATSPAVSPMPASRATPTAVGPRPLPRAEFERRLDRAKNDPDAMSEMGEMESLRLQMAMDRSSKLMSTLSNMLKKMSDTSAGITRNIK